MELYKDFSNYTNAWLFNRLKRKLIKILNDTFNQFIVVMVRNTLREKGFCAGIPFFIKLICAAWHGLIRAGSVKHAHKYVAHHNRLNKIINQREVNLKARIFFKALGRK